MPEVIEVATYTDFIKKNINGAKLMDIIIISGRYKTNGVFKNYKALNYTLFWKGLLITTNIFLAYFVNRLMYTMCTKSLM